MLKKMFVLLGICLMLAGCSDHTATMGVIGGADGPTSIFMMSNWTWLGLMFLALVFLAVAVCFVFFVVWWKNK